MASAGQFNISNGSIIDPSGNTFVARGINVFLGQVDATTIRQTFPGINAVRLATTPGADQAAIDSLVQGLTQQKIVVEIEDHSSSGGNPNTLSGQALTNEASWYAGLAAKYQTNPYVWFGTANEPDNTANLQAVPAQESAIYNAIRGTGSKAITLLEMRGGFTNDAAQQYSSTYASMTNVVWDTHYYGWVVNQSTDMPTIVNGLKNQIANAQSVKSADGVVPVIVGEYGPSTSGIAAYDANGLQVVQAVDNSGYGTLAWAWNAGTDSLTTTGTNLSDFGHLVAQHIAAGASAAPATPTPTAPVTAPSTAPVTAPITVPAPVTTPAGLTIGSGADSLALSIAEDAWQGDAQFTVSVDGVQIGGTQTATASHGAGQLQLFNIKGGFGSGQHTTTVNFLNDAWGGSAATDRNLYVNSATIDGTAIANSALALMSGGPKSLAFGSPVAQDTIDLHVSEDAWQGDAQFSIAIDGTTIGGTRTVTASHAAGATQDVAVSGNWGSGAHTIGVTFLNDAWGGSGSTDRNLYIDQVSYNGKVTGAPVGQFGNGTATFQAPAASTGTSLQIGMSEDAWNGDAQYSITLDGKAVGNGGSITASHGLGQSQIVALQAMLTPGQHDLGVSFLNDAWGGTASTDRNLYVNNVSVGGQPVSGASAALFSAGTSHFTITVPTL